MSERTGQQFGNYRLSTLLGRGGFAEVYLGEHVYLKTQAAIKILRTRLSREEQEMFYAEARTIAHLQHEHIVRVLEFGLKDETIPYLVMEYAPNGTLRERFPRGTPVPAGAILEPLKQVAAALHYAHSEHLIHRDIKPENMLLGAHNEVLLSDFGIAVMVKSSRQQDSQEVAGTITYMAPEQLLGKPQAASDQYALGVVVYEWLTGERPFRGSFSEIASQHVLTPPPSLRERVPTISEAVERVVLTALAKDPQQRFASTQDFASALELAVQSGPSSTAGQGTPLPSNVTQTGMNTPRTTPSTAPVFQSWNPQTATTPPQQPVAPQARSRPPLSTGLKIALAVLALLLIAGSGGLAYALLGPRDTQPSKAQQMQELYNRVTSGKPIIEDSMSADSILAWNLINSCTFKEGALHTATVPYGQCIANYIDIDNFVYQAEVTIIDGVEGGLIFRYNWQNALKSGTSGAYFFKVTTTGEFAFSIQRLTLQQTTNATSTLLIKPQRSTAIRTGLKQSNLLTVIARNSTIDLFINRQYVASINDNTILSGSIGMFGNNDVNKKTLDVLLKNVQVWSL